MDYDFKAIQDAGLSHQDFGDLIGVSRVTVCKWCNGRADPSHLIAGEVASTLETIRRRVDEGKLPVILPDSREAVREERIRLLMMALQ